eukprot:1288-Heterococcus_DN1.PRE.3
MADASPLYTAAAHYQPYTDYTTAISAAPATTGHYTVTTAAISQQQQQQQQHEHQQLHQNTATNCKLHNTGPPQRLPPEGQPPNRL